MNPFDEIEDNEIQIKETKFIEIWMESTGRKKNTFISGWCLSDVELKEHIKIIKKKTSCGGTLKEIENDDGESYNIIQLQGNHIDYVRSYLKDQNIDSDLIKIKG